MTEVRRWRFWLAWAAGVFGLLGLAIAIVGVLTALDEPAAMDQALWWAGPILIVVGLDAVVVRAYLPLFVFRPRRARNRYALILAANVVVLSLAAVLILYFVWAIAWDVVYCNAVAWDGCGP